MLCGVLEGLLLPGISGYYRVLAGDTISRNLRNLLGSPVAFSLRAAMFLHAIYLLFKLCHLMLFISIL
eukprot:1357891-Amorphochlora_amoeboformis.AAC.1